MGPAQYGVCEINAPYKEETFEPPSSNAFRIQKPDGSVILDHCVKMTQDHEVAFQYDGYPMVGKLFASGLITHYDATIPGEGLKGIIVQGKVTATMVDDNSKFRPTI